MHWRTQDYHLRQQMHRDYMECIRAARKEGILDKLHPAIGKLARGMFPLYRGKNGVVTIPEDFDPASKVPILYLRPGEALPVDSSKNKTIGRMIAAGAGIDRTALDTPNYGRVMAQIEEEYGNLHYSSIQVAPECENDERRLYVQKPTHLSLVDIDNLNFGRDFALQAGTIVTTHELDHWDFFTRRVPEKYQQFRPKNEEVKTASEREAYTTSAIVETHFNPSVPTMAWVKSAEHYTDRELNDILDLALRVQRYHGIIAPYLLARVVSTLYPPSPNELSSENEVLLYRLRGLIARQN